MIQAQSAQRLQISETQLFTLMDEVSLVANKQLVIVGPIFGGEALENLRKRLDVVGFVYFDDYFCIEPQHPDWCDFGICLRENSDAELKQ